MNFKLESFVLFLMVVTDFGKNVLSYDSKCPPLKLSSGRSRYQWGGRSVRFNCMRRFQLVGVKYATCVNGKWDAEVPICVKNGCRAPSTVHVNGQLIESYRGAVVKIVCNPGYTLMGSPSVYCNGVKWNETFPVCRALNLNPALSCNFENEDLCGWSQDPMHDFDWKRRLLSDPGNNKSSPDNARGYYMYMENSSWRTEADTARLFSPVYQSTGRTCFRFWYRMLGIKSGFLKVYVKPENVQLWSIIPSFWINKEQGITWRQGYFIVEPMNSPFQIVFEGSRDPYDPGETAFDDVALTSTEECIFLENASSSTETTSPGTDEYSPSYLSCKNRCGEEKNETAPDPDKCYCYDTCDRDNTCCYNYLEMCFGSTSTAIESTTQTDVVASSSSSSPSTLPSVVPNNKLPSPKFSPKYFNNESNDIEPEKPLAPIPPRTTPNRTSNEIHGPYHPTPPRTTPKSTSPQPRPKSAIVRIDTASKTTLNATKTSNRVVPLVVLQKPVLNRTKSQKVPANEIPPRKVLPELERKAKPEVVVKSTSVTSSSSASTSPARGFKKSNPNNIKLTFLEKPSRPNLPNDPPFTIGKPKEVSGKEPPQAIKIDKSGESGGVPIREIVEFGGAALVILAIVVLAFVAYKRRESRKSERGNMVEDSDSIVYEMDSSTPGSEYHSLVCIRPGGLRQSL